MKDKTLLYCVGTFVAGILFGAWMVGLSYRGMGGMWADMMHGTTYYGTQYQGGRTMMNTTDNGN